MKPPLVSVMIPNYNYGRFVCDAVRSALAQTGPFELDVCVVDNASTDDSIARLRGEFGEDPRFRVVARETNIGMLPNLLDARFLARGEFVQFLSADDELLPGHIARATAYYAQHPEIDVYYTGYTWADAEMRSERFIEHPGYLGLDFARGRDELYGLLRWESYVCYPTVLFRRRVLECFGGAEDPAIEIAGDFAQFVRYALDGARFAFEAAPGARIRRHGSNASGVDRFVANGTQARDFLAVAERVAAAEPAGHVARAALDTIARAERDLQSWPDAAAAFARDHAARLTAVRATLERCAEAALPARPLVTVVLTTRGDISRLRDALASVAAQSYDRWEIVLAPVGAPSLDPVVASLPYADRVATFRLRKYTGAAWARNTATEFARGDVVAFLDEQDEWAPEHLATVLPLLARAPIARTGAQFALEYDDASREMARTRIFSEALPSNGAWASPVHVATPLSSIAVRRAVAETTTFDDLPILEDWDYVMRLAGAHPGAHDPRPTVTIGHVVTPFAPFIEKSALLGPVIERVYARTAIVVSPELLAQRQAWRGRLHGAVEAVRAQHTGDNVLRAVRVLHGAA